MIFVFVLTALWGIVSGDVSEIIRPSRGYLPPPSRAYLPPAAVPRTFVPTTPSPIASTYQQDGLVTSTVSPFIVQDAGILSTFAPQIVTTVAPPTEIVPINRKYLPPVSGKSLFQLQEQVSLLPPIPSIGTPNGVTITSNANDLDILTNIISQNSPYSTPSPGIVTTNSPLTTNLLGQSLFSTTLLPQTTGAVTTDSAPTTNFVFQPILSAMTLPQSIVTANLVPTTIAPQVAKLTLVTDISPDFVTTAQPTPVPESVRSASVTSTEKDTTTSDPDSDPILRINASELLETAREDAKELAAASTTAETSTPETVLSEDGYHYNIPLFSFGSSLFK